LHRIPFPSARIRPQRTEHLGLVLAQTRGAVADLPRCLFENERRAGMKNVAADLVVEDRRGEAPPTKVPGFHHPLGCREHADRKAAALPLHEELIGSEATGDALERLAAVAENLPRGHVREDLDQADAATVTAHLEKDHLGELAAQTEL